MLFMVVETFAGGDMVPIYRHMAEKGRGLPDGVSRGLVIAASVAIVIPYVQFLTGPIMWLFVAVAMQRAVNQIVQHDRSAAGAGASDADASPRAKSRR